MNLQKFAVHELDQYQWEASVSVASSKSHDQSTLAVVLLTLESKLKGPEFPAEHKNETLNCT